MRSLADRVEPNPVRKSDPVSIEASVKENPRSRPRVIARWFLWTRRGCADSGWVPRYLRGVYIGKQGVFTCVRILMQT